MEDWWAHFNNFTESENSRLSAASCLLKKRSARIQRVAIWPPLQTSGFCVFCSARVRGMHEAFSGIWILEISRGQVTMAIIRASLAALNDPL